MAASRVRQGVALLLLVLLLVGLPASAASPDPSADPAPPSAPRIVYAQGYFCLTLIVGVDRSTDNQTPQSQLTYDVFADGRRIGSMADLGSTSGVWSIQHLTHTGPNTITVKAVDAGAKKVVVTEKGTLVTVEVKVTGDTVIETAKGERVPLEELQAGSRVHVTHDEDDVASKIVVRGPARKGGPKTKRGAPEP